MKNIDNIEINTAYKKQCITRLTHITKTTTTLIVNIFVSNTLHINMEIWHNNYLHVQSSTINMPFNAN